MSLHSSEVQNLSPDQISSTYLNLRPRYNYFRFGKTNVRHIGTLLPVATSTISQLLAWHTILRQTTKFRPNWAYFRFRIWWCHFLPKVSVYQRTKFHQHILIHGWDITTSGLDKQLFAILEFYFRFRIWWRRFLQNIHIYQQTKFRSTSSIHSWHITISGFEKQSSAILKFYFRFRLRPHHRSRHIILHQSAKFHLNRTAHGSKITSCRFDFQDGVFPPSWILDVQ